MKRKLIEGIPWQSTGEKENMSVAAKVHSIGGEDVLIIDFAMDKPLIRIALSHNDFENYVPEESPCTNVPRWGRRKYEDFLRGNGLLLLPYSIYRNWKTLADRETADIIHRFVYGEDDKSHTDWNCDIDYLQREISWRRQEQAEIRRHGRIERKNV